MRVLAGTLRGRGLRTLRGLATRPTLGRVKESIFAILGQTTRGSCVLDLFSGAGLLGIEAFSRGAACVDFVDRDISCIRVLRENLEALGLVGKSTVIRDDAIRALGRAARGGRKFSLIFVDPPYCTGLAERALRAINDCGVISETGWIVVEHSSKESLPEKLGSLSCRDMRRYGSTLVSFYRAEGEAAGCGASGG